MNQEEREALTQQTTQRMVACLQHTTNAKSDLANAEEMIRSMLTSYGLEMFAAGGRNTEEWIRRTVASLLIPIFMTRTLPEGSGGDTVLAYHWQTLDREADGVTFAYCLEQALLAVLHRQEQQP
jgi:hypothetical protein